MCLRIREWEIAMNIVVNSLKGIQILWGKLYCIYWVFDSSLMYININKKRYVCFSILCNVYDVNSVNVYGAW